MTVTKREDLPLPDTKIYACEVVRITPGSETRLFIGAGRLYTHNAKKEIQPPKEFVDALLKASGKDYYCVDVAQFADRPDEWFMVEVNPPIGSGDNGCPIEPYVRFTMDAQRHWRL